MGINWVGAGGVIGGGGGGFVTALGGFVAAGMIIQYWQIFAFVALGIVVLHCLCRKPQPPAEQVEATAAAQAKFDAIVAAQIERPTR